MQHRRLYILLGGLVIIGSVLISYVIIARQQAQEAITTYEECVASGYPVQESYPARCVVSNDKSFTQSTSDQPQSISIDGKVVCLPHKDTDGPHDLACAIGLKTDDGRYYSLRSEIPGTSLASAAGDDRKVRITGTLKNEESTTYQSKGIITVHSFDFI